MQRAPVRVPRCLRRSADSRPRATCRRSRATDTPRRARRSRAEAAPRPVGAARGPGATSAPSRRRPPPSRCEGAGRPCRPRAGRARCRSRTRPRVRSEARPTAGTGPRADGERGPRRSRPHARASRAAPKCCPENVHFATLSGQATERTGSLFGCHSRVLPPARGSQMYDQISMERLQELRGAPVFDASGDKIGSVEEVFLDGETHQPEWIGLGTGFFGTKRVLVPVAGASLSPDAVTVRYPKDQVKDAPDVDAAYLTPQDEQALYSYYGIPYGTSSSDTVLPEGERDYDRQVDLEDADRQAVTRHEEELRVGTREVEAGRLRLHKWVETEQVEVPVEVKKEKARVYREPVDGEATGHEIGDDSIEVTLSEEQPVVEKRTVAKERLGIEKTVETEQQTVGDEVRKERVDVDDSTAA